jgi:Cu/Ag efflux protein CusF
MPAALARLTSYACEWITPVRSILFAILLLIPIGACSRKPEVQGPQRHYQLTGKIVGLDAEHQTASIDAAAIPNFMGAMTMDYPIPSKAEFKSLHAGDTIKGTLNVSASGDEYSLTNIRKQNAAK